MNRIAIFVEGKTEVIFVRRLIEEYFANGRISIASIQSRGKSHWIKYKLPDGFDYLCLLIDAGGDEGVLPAIRENYAGMAEQGFSFFLGLRDLKSKAYEKYGDQIIEGHNSTIEEFSSGNVYFHFAKMETEAWFLAAPSFLPEINSSLTREKVNTILGYDLWAIDPQEDIPKPANEIRKLIGSYRKNDDDIHRIVSRISFEALCVQAIEDGKVSFFKAFLKSLEKCFE